MIEADYRPLKDTSKSRILGTTTEIPAFVVVCGQQVECIRFTNDIFTTQAWKFANEDVFLCGSVCESSIVMVLLTSDGRPTINWLGSIPSLPLVLTSEFASIVDIKACASTCYILLTDNSIIDVTRGEQSKIHLLWADLDIPISPILVFDVISSQFAEGCTWTVIGLLHGTLCVMRRCKNGLEPCYLSVCIDGPVFSLMVDEFEDHVTVTVGSQGFVCRCVLEWDKENNLLTCKSFMVLLSGLQDSVTAITSLDVSLIGSKNTVIGTSSGSIFALSCCEASNIEWEVCLLHPIVDLFCLDLNQDSLDELVVATSAGLHVFRISPIKVSAKINLVLFNTDVSDGVVPTTSSQKSNLPEATQS